MFFPLDEPCILVVRVTLSQRPRFKKKNNTKKRKTTSLRIQAGIVGVLECFLPVFCILEEFKLEKPMGYFQLVDNPGLAA